MWGCYIIPHTHWALVPPYFLVSFIIQHIKKAVFKKQNMWHCYAANTLIWMKTSWFFFQCHRINILLWYCWFIMMRYHDNLTACFSHCRNLCSEVFENGFKMFLWVVDLTAKPISSSPTSSLPCLSRLWLPSASSLWTVHCSQHLLCLSLPQLQTQ